MEGCIFCKIVNGELPCFKIYEDDRVLSFADINPVSDGHTLVIPKQHAENLYEIADEDLAAVQVASKKIMHALRNALKPLGVVAVQLNGRAVNQVIMHYHLHLIPRLEGSPELKWTGWEMKPGDMDLIKATAEKIAQAV